MSRFTSRPGRRWYHARVLASMVGVLLLLIALVNLWPASKVDSSGPASWSDVQPVQMDEILQTVQAGGRPPPPPPPPIPVVDIDFLVDLPELDFDITLPDAPSHELPGLPGDGSAEVSAGPEHREAARPIRFVEPEYTSEARRLDLRAEMDVQLRVDQAGRVVNMDIIQAYLVDAASGERRAVDTVGYGLEEAALNAASRWFFRPAHASGEPVESVFTVTFTFGD